MRLTILVLLAYLFIAILNVNANASPSKAQIENYIVVTAIRYGVDPELALAIAKVESQLDHSRIGSLGEIGIYQIRPEYHKGNLHNMYFNIRTGVKYLADLKQECSRYGDAYFICYNNGPYRNPKYPTLFPYYKKVMAEMWRNSNLIAKGE